MAIVHQAGSAGTGGLIEWWGNTGNRRYRRHNCCRSTRPRCGRTSAPSAGGQYSQAPSSHREVGTLLTWRVNGGNNIECLWMHSYLGRLVLAGGLGDQSKRCQASDPCEPDCRCHAARGGLWTPHLQIYPHHQRWSHAQNWMLEQ